MEKTFIILKPDCLEKGLVGQVVQRFESEGFEIVATKMALLEAPILKEHYAHVADLPFFPDIEAFMSSRPVILMAWQGENVIQRVGGERASRIREARPQPPLRRSPLRALRLGDPRTRLRGRSGRLP